MKNINLKQGLKNGTIFEDICYEDFKIYHNVTTDQYYVKVKHKPLKQVTLLTEIRYPDDLNISDDALLSGFGRAKKGFDYSGEFTELLETAGPYLHRYGYFAEVTENQPDIITELINI